MHRIILFLPSLMVFLLKTSTFFGTELLNNKEIFLKKAAQYYRQNKLDKAIAVYSQILKNDPYNFDALINIGAAFIRKGSFLEAYPYIKRLIKRFPEKADSWINLAVCEIGLGRLKEALKHLEIAEKKLDCPEAIILLHKGIIFSKLGKLDKALRFYKKAEELAPDNPDLLFNMAILYEKKKDYKNAILYYQLYINKHPPTLSSAEKDRIEDRIYFLKNYFR